MSEWLDDSASSNKLKQSYFQNFIDVSGIVSIRNNNNLNLYNDAATPEFSINSNEIRVKVDDNNGNDVYYDISNSKLQYIKDLTINVEDRLNYLTTKTQNISDDSTGFINDVSMNGDVDISGSLNITGNLTVTDQNSITIINTTVNEYTSIVTEDISLNGKLSVSGDVSFNSTGRVDVCGNFYAQ